MFFGINEIYMEKPKPTQSLEQKQETPEDYVVATFPVDIDPDNARRPLTVIRSGQDGEDVKYDRGWNPIGMSVVCDTDSEEGIGPIKLLMEAYKLVGTDIKTEFVPLEDIQDLNEDYIKYLYGKTPREMAAKGAEAAERIWRQKHPVGSEIESLASEVGSDSGAESPSNSSVEDTSGHEKSLADKVGPAMGNMAVKTAGVKKPADLAATESVKKPVEVDKAIADLVDLPAAKSVENPVTEKSMETNEANVDILPESFKSVINKFEKDTKDNNNQFFAKAKYITGELDRLRGLIKYNPTAAMNDPVISEMITSEPDRIRDLEASRDKDANKFKNNMDSLLEGLESKIENDDERRRLVKITEHVGQMGVDNTVLGNVTNGLSDKLIRIRRYIEGWQNDRWGADGYKSNISQVIGEIISDLSTASGRRQNIVDGIKRIKSEGYYQER